MKKIFSLVLVLVLAVSAMFVFTACGEEPEVEPPVEETYYNVTYVYVDGDKEVELSTQKVAASVGFTDKMLAAAEALTHNGYGFAEWYYDAACTQKFDYSADVTADLKLYACRGNLAGANVQWFINPVDATLYFFGYGPMYNYANKEDAPWDVYRADVTNVVFSDGITTIGDYACTGMTKITKVLLPDDLCYIGSNAFNGCNKVTEVRTMTEKAQPVVNGVSAVFSLPAGVTTMGISAFANCSALVGPVVLPEGLTAIPDGCFYHCIEISAIVIPKSVTNVGPTAFKVPDNNGGYRNLMLKYAYYTGTEAEWNAVEKGVDNYRLFDKALFFFYSEEAPEAAGPYWYYAEDENGNDLGVRQWYFAIRYATVSPNNAAQLLFLFNDYVEVDQETYTATLTTANKEYMDNIEVNGYKYGGFYLVDKHEWTNANKTDIKKNFANLTYV